MFELKGSIAQSGLLSVMETLADQRLTGRLELSRGSWSAELGFDDGWLIAASFGAESGAAALSAVLLAFGEGEFRYLRGPTPTERFPSYSSYVNDAIDGSGNVFVIEGHNNRIQKFNRFGIWLKTWFTMTMRKEMPYTPVMSAIWIAGRQWYWEWPRRFQGKERKKRLERKYSSITQRAGAPTMTQDPILLLISL